MPKEFRKFYPVEFEYDEISDGIWMRYFRIEFVLIRKRVWNINFYKKM